MDTLKVGVIGCGSLARATHLKHLAEMDGAELRWVCDIDAEARERACRDFGARQATADFHGVTADPETDAIVVATAQNLRLPVIEAAARNGKGVYCEKPIAGSVEEMEQIRQVVHQTGIVFCAGHNRRSAPALVWAREAFEAAKQPRAKACWVLDRNADTCAAWPETRQMTIVARINDDLRTWKDWAFMEDVAAYGPMLFEMTHFTDIVCLFAGKHPIEVSAQGHLRSNQTVTVTFDDGSLATILMTGVGTFSYPKELYEFYVNNTAVVLDHFLEVRTGDVPGFPARRVFPYAADPHPDVADGGGTRDWFAKRERFEAQAVAGGHSAEWLMEHEGAVDKGHRQHLARFLDAVRGDRESPCTIDEAILATRVAFAAIDSLRRQQHVAVDA